MLVTDRLGCIPPNLGGLIDSYTATTLQRSTRTSCPPLGRTVRMATARARKAFKWPEEADEPDSEGELDEEHQEQLITSLQAQDAAKNDLYRKAFLAIPLAGALFFLYSFLLLSRTAQQRTIALLGVSSLLCTAYILHFMPLQAPDRKGKIPVYRLEAARGPVEKYLVYLNAALAALMLLAAAVSWRKGNVENAWREALPAIILGLTAFVRQQLAPLDLEELQRARYEYKGA